MKMRIVRTGRKRRGLATIYVSLYLAVLGILLLSTLFLSQSMSNSALAESIRLEQERLQERITLRGPNALNISQGSIVSSVLVNNTGSVTVRIRALYIGETFVCDPSTFGSDSYIEPKGSKWIQLLANQIVVIFNTSTLDAYWTMTTERGTSASETGGALRWGSDLPDLPPLPKRFYMGPFMILFDLFDWRSGTGPWKPGWTIPKSTVDVTWRIMIVNVDDRDLIIEDKSCLTIISNDNSPKDPKPWYIDPTTTKMTFEPGVYNFVYFKWDKPSSEGGAKPQGMSGMTEATTCITFLTFYGFFVEPDSSLTPLGQTIPFEAVLVSSESMADSVKLTANPLNILNDGVSSSKITIVVEDSAGSPVPDAWVDFYTSAGTLSIKNNRTDSNGYTTVTLQSSLFKTTAYITAVCQSVLGTCSVTFTPATNVTVQAFPNIIGIDEQSTLTVQLVDATAQPVLQEGLSITVTISSWTGSASKAPLLSYEGVSSDSQIVTTNRLGLATLTLIAEGSPGTATITVSADGLNSGNCLVVVIE